jgi:hypothetical protein
MGTTPTAGPNDGRERLYPTGFPIRCTHKEKEIYARAKRANRSASRFLVELGTLEAGQPLAPRPSPEELAALEALMVQLRKVGVNLNQLAHREHASAYTDIEPPSDGEVREAVRAVEEMLRLIRARLA